MDKELIEQTETILKDYKILKAKIDNIEMDIDELQQEYKGCSGIDYSESSGSSGKFNSIVENEVVDREKRLNVLKYELANMRKEVKRIEDALGVLKELHYNIIYLRYCKGMKWEQVGAALGRSGQYCRTLSKGIIHKLTEILFIGEIYIKSI